MKRKSGFIALLFLAAATAAALFGQDITAWINGVGGKPALAVIDFRGTGAEPIWPRSTPPSSTTSRIPDCST